MASSYVFLLAAGWLDAEGVGGHIISKKSSHGLSLFQVLRSHGIFVFVCTKKETKGMFLIANAIATNRIKHCNVNSSFLTSF